MSDIDRGFGKNQDIVEFNLRPLEVNGSINYYLYLIERDNSEVVEEIRHLTGFKDAILVAGSVVDFDNNHLGWAIGYKRYKSLDTKVCILCTRLQRPPALGSEGLARWLFGTLEEELATNQFQVGKSPTHVRNDNNFMVATLPGDLGW